MLGQHDYRGWGGADSSLIDSHGREEKRERDASSRRPLRCVAVLVSSRPYDIIRETGDESGKGVPGYALSLLFQGRLFLVPKLIKSFILKNPSQPLLRSS